MMNTMRNGFVIDVECVGEEKEEKRLGKNLTCRLWRDVWQKGENNINECFVKLET